ncbi:MAG: ferrochelatase [Deltaproteobacteria bacterium RIFCSPHIGHO2_02_FULL_40_11]|nr:MAG: ferrochelatase [Deltaproteobacteria bacterium RIFCSPHIGHO2_02_FULL_40_11]
MKPGVLLFNLGGPEKIGDVKPFLVNLFSDPEIIPVPFAKILQKPLAHFIASRRQKMSEGYYRAIGGGSPLLKITRAQAESLEASLKEDYPNLKTYTAMRYWKPSVKDALEEIRKDGITDLVLLPLYPQRSKATMDSSYGDFYRVMPSANSIKLHPIYEWYHHPKYIEAFTENIQREIDALPEKYKNKFHLIFSAHSLPVKWILEGDPYEKQIHETCHLMLKNLRGVQRWHLSYQSRTKYLKWLEPSTLDLFKKLSSDTDHALILVPLSFVSDHVETLYEIDILYQKEAKALGYPYVKRVESLNTQPTFIAALKDLVLNELRGAS